MTQPTLHFIDCPEPKGGHHRMAWWQWGDAAAAHALICVHGLTRQGRDFDAIAQAAVARATQAGRSIRVVCPDIVGRGRSDWLANAQSYQYATYAADIQALLAALGAEARLDSFDWIGTSMGGVIGILVAAQNGKDGSAPRLRHLILNDVGPVVQWSAIERIGKYVGNTPTFPTVEAAARYLRDESAGFGPCSDAAWLALSRPQLRERPEGGWRLHYDPAIAAGWKALTPDSLARGEATLWGLYDQISAPTLLLRGAESDLLAAEVAKAMSARGPRPRVVEFAGVGHAPMLMAADQQAAVLDFLFSST